MKKAVHMIVGSLLILATATLVLAYPNLASNTSTKQQSTKIKNNVTLHSGLAVDGKKRKKEIQYCAQTKNVTNPWWYVKLNTTSNIIKIKIWPRKGKKPQQRDYEIYISDNGTCNTGIACKNVSVIDDKMNVQCAGVGDYVVICGKKDQHMSMALCEVEVYGCPKENYGSKCRRQCGHCRDLFCSLANGTCQEGCKSKYWGDKCDKDCLYSSCNTEVCEQATGVCTECKPGYWGDSCNNSCQSNCKNNKCKRESGHCFACKAGFYTETCNTSCPSKCKSRRCRQRDGKCSRCVLQHWGEKCTEMCPSGCNAKKCTQDGGQCLGCNEGFWGNTCNKSCGNCLQISCTQYNGSCLSECKVGFAFPKCVYPTQCKGKQNTENCTDGCQNSHFGLMCTKHCNANCANRICKQESGLCQSCAAGYWGGTCNESCSPNCIGESCTQFDSTCVNGCTSAYSGTMCNQAVPLTSDDINKTIAVGVVVPLLLIASATIAAIFVIGRRRAKKARYADGNFDVLRSISKQGNEIALNVELEDELENDSNVNGNIDSNPPLISQNMVSIGSLGQKIRQNQANNTFKDEFETLPTGLRHPHEVGKANDNLSKNKYLGIFPYDHSRVVLCHLPGQLHSDYINSNYIENLEGKKRYIAAQAPNKRTIRDFWRMIWQSESEIIVMLTNLIDGTKVKCECYWPESGGKLVVGNLALRMTSEKVLTAYTIRTFVVSEDGSTSRTITQFQFTAWPDHGVTDPLQLTKFHRHVRQCETNNSWPIVVHCSAGIGRTGTYIALDALFDFGKKHGQVDIPGYVAKMRYNRMNMIQTIDQYKLLYEALYEECMYPSSAIPRTSYLDEYPKLSNVSATPNSSYADTCLDPTYGKPTNQTQISLEFEKIMTMRKEFAKCEYEAAILEENVKKNRAGYTIAVEKHRPFLSTNVLGSTNYINAVIIPGCLVGHMYILTQIPLTTTVFDFWRMVYDQKSNVVVKLNEVPSAQPPVCILPCDDGPFTIGQLTVAKDRAASIFGDINEQTFTIIHKITNDTQKVKVLEVQNWEASCELPPSTKLLLYLVDRVSRWQKQVGLHPVTIMCLNGSTCSGLYCAVSKLIDQVTTEQIVDVYQTVREIQYRCPQCLNNFEQYRVCYQTIKDYLSDDDTYVNT